MLSDYLIRKIAKKIGWNFKTTLIAINKLEKESSIIKDWKGFFQECLKYNSPDERNWEVLSYLLRLNQNNTVETICSVLSGGEPCFQVLATFNLSELRNSKDIINPAWTIGMLNTREEEKAFYLKVKVDKPFPHESMACLEQDPRCNAINLTDEFVSFLYGRPGEINEHEVFLEVIARLGFVAFNSEMFRHTAIEYTNDPKMREHALDLMATLSDPFMSRRNYTEKKHWIYYVFVEHFKGEYGLRGAIRKISKDLNVPNGTIHSRYFERKKIARKLNLSIQDIIAKYGLTLSIKYLQENVS